MKISNCSGQKVGHRRSCSARGYAESPESEDTRNPRVAVLDLYQVHEVAAEGNLVPAANPIHILVEPEVREVQKHHIDRSGIAHHKIAGYDQRYHAWQTGVAWSWAIRKALDSKTGKT